MEEGLDSGTNLEKHEKETRSNDAWVQIAHMPSQPELILPRNLRKLLAR
jgi:hypothetical protein